MSNPGITAAFADNILAWLCTATAMPTAPTGLFIQLHTGEPGAAGTANISVGSTTREAAGFAAPSGGVASQSGTAPSWTNGGTSETISYISYWGAATSGTFYESVAVTSPQAWASGNVITATSYTLNFTPIAA
jgi:hypothetical protein